MRSFYLRSALERYSHAFVSLERELHKASTTVSCGCAGWNRQFYLPSDQNVGSFESACGHIV